MKKRVLFYEIMKHFRTQEAVVITGMRQVGKTTLMRQIFEKIGEVSKTWFDLDNPLDQKFFEELDYENIYIRLKEKTIGKGRMTVFIDEIQNFPEITRIMKYLIDHYKIKFVVTGSSNYYLRNLFPESMAGRKFLYELPPLSFLECLYFWDQLVLDETTEKDILKFLKKPDIINFEKRKLSYERYLEFGSFPKVVLTDSREERELVLRNIFSSFFEKDIKLLEDLGQIRALRDLLLLLAPRVGSILDISKISSELGINRPRIYQFLEFLQGTFMIRLIPQFSRSIDRAVAGGKKVYFTDNGLLNVLGQVSEGQALENAVCNQLFQYGSLAYFNRRNTAEIDFILDKKIAFEVKTRGSETDYVKLKKLSEGLKISQFFVLTKHFDGNVPGLVPALLP